MTALDFMQDLVSKGITETQGKNRSEVIDDINHEVGNPMGAPYCAATVSHCFRKCVDQQGEPFPYSGGSQAIKRAFAAHDLLSTNPNDLKDWTGALGGWTDTNDPAHGHIFFVKGRLTDPDGNVTGLITLEANTSPQTQDRDGEGCYQLERSIESLQAKHPNFWFLDCSDVKGGAWWTA